MFFGTKPDYLIVSNPKNSTKGHGLSKKNFPTVYQMTYL